MRLSGWRIRRRASRRIGSICRGPRFGTATTRNGPVKDPFRVFVFLWLAARSRVVRLEEHGLAVRRPESLVDELLNALPLVGLGRVQVTSRVHVDGMDAEELAGPMASRAPVTHDAQRLT